MAEKLIVEIALGNDAMRTRGDAAMALIRVGQRLAETAPDEPFGAEHEGLEFKIADGNGNTVGKWEVV